MQISYLPEPDKYPLWSDILRLLKPAAEVGGIEPYYDGDLIWIAFEGPTLFAAMSTCLADDVAIIRCVGGARLNEWLPEWADTFEKWARDCGAEWLECRGRKGWGRFASSFGWRFSHTDEDGLPVFEKELN